MEPSTLAVARCSTMQMVKVLGWCMMDFLDRLHTLRVAIWLMLSQFTISHGVEQLLKLHKLTIALLTNRCAFGVLHHLPLLISSVAEYKETAAIAWAPHAVCRGLCMDAALNLQCRKRHMAMHYCSDTHAAKSSGQSNSLFFCTR